MERWRQTDRAADHCHDTFLQKLCMLVEPRGGCAICEQSHARGIVRGLHSPRANQLSAKSRLCGCIFYIIQELETPQLSESGWQIRNSYHAPAAIRVPCFSRGTPTQQIIRTQQDDNRECNASNSDNAGENESGNDAKLHRVGSRRHGRDPSRATEQIKAEDASEESQRDRQPRHTLPPPEKSDTRMPENEPEEKRHGKPVKNAKGNRFVCESQALPVAENHHWHEEDRRKHDGHDANPRGNGNAGPYRLLRRWVAGSRKKLCQSPQAWSKSTAEVYPSRVLQFRRQLAGTEE